MFPTSTTTAIKTKCTVVDYANYFCGFVYAKTEGLCRSNFIKRRSAAVVNILCVYYCIILSKIINYK